MDKRVIELSKYIDRMNAGKRNPRKGSKNKDGELEMLYKTVKSVRNLKEPVMPGRDYPKRLANNVAVRLRRDESSGIIRRRWFTGTAAVAAIVLVVFFLNLFLPFGRLNVVNAMEKAYQSLRAYHGIIEITENTGEGGSFLQSRLEVWADKEGRYYLKQLEGFNEGVITVNNGRTKWQLRPDEKVSQIYSAFPDAYKYIFEIGKEIEDARNALVTREIGKENLFGRDTVILEVTPQGGNPYRLWIDAQTNLPLKKETAMQNGLQYTVAYTVFEMLSAIPEERMAYALPEGFNEVDQNPEKYVGSLEEAAQLAGFVPQVPDSLPAGYILDSIAVQSQTGSIKLNYRNHMTGRVTILQSSTEDALVPASGSIIGKIGEMTAEIQSPLADTPGILGAGGLYAGSDASSIRWQKDGYEYAIVGDVTLEEMAEFASCLDFGEVKIPEANNIKIFNPQVEVPVDMEVERSEQKSVDAGHSPWRLDPLFVSQVFVSLKLQPEGITGDYPIRYEDLSMVYNSGVEAIVEVAGETPVRRVYLKRLVRQDSTGIWTVVGYDPASAK